MANPTMRICEHCDTSAPFTWETDMCDNCLSGQEEHIDWGGSDWQARYDRTLREAGRGSGPNMLELLDLLEDE